MKKEKNRKTRVYHPYHLWEEHQFGMWKSVPVDRQSELLRAAIEFTGDALLYGSYMMRVAREWLISCEQNLLDPSLNRQAWIGHAACALAIGCPEHLTRKAWWHLSQQQQDDANAQADLAILSWEGDYFARKSAEDGQLCLKLDWE